MSAKRARVRRDAPRLDVPRAGEDAAERKRVLNVLAQRRYRQRRRQHVQKLEQQLSSIDAGPHGCPSEPNSQSQSSMGPGHLTPHDDQGFEIDDSPIADDQQLQVSFDPDLPFLDGQMPSPGVDEAALQTQQGQPAYVPNPVPAHLSSQKSFSSRDGTWFIPDTDSQWLNSLALLPSPCSSPPSETPNYLSDEGTAQSGSLSHPTLFDESLRPPCLTTLPSLGRDTSCSFPDEAFLEMTELTLLRGCMSIARRLNVEEIIWSLSSNSPFTEPAMALAEFTHLPPNLQPTVGQMTVPHHPVIDLLPWPSVRNRLVMVLSQPPELRPPSAASPMALVDLVYDIEDSAEGVRISGSDPYSDRNWEVGEKVFKSWWWCFDKDIIRRSNELRASRGAPMLGTGSILGEVA